MIISSALFTTIIQSNYPSRKSWLFSILKATFAKTKTSRFHRKKKRQQRRKSANTFTKSIHTHYKQKPWRNFWCLTWNVDNFRFWSQRIERIHPILGILIMILQSGILMLIQTKKWILHFLEAGAEFKYSRHLIFQHVVEITMFKVFFGPSAPLPLPSVDPELLNTQSFPWEFFQARKLAMLRQQLGRQAARRVASKSGQQLQGRLTAEIDRSEELPCFNQQVQPRSQEATILVGATFEEIQFSKLSEF